MPIRPRSPLRSRREGLWRHWGLWIWFALALFLTVGGVMLWKSGRWLVHEDSFQKVPWALVLAGESRDCERTDAAIKLYREGRIDTIVLSGCRVFKTRYQSEFMVDYVAEQGVPRGKIFEFRQDAYSTLEEAQLLIRQFRLQNLDTVLIITSNYHTARTRRIFRKLAQGYPQVLVYPAEYHTYDPAAWWSNRESMKYWFNEWIKTFYTFIELARTPAENGKADFQNLVPDIWSGRATTGVTSRPGPSESALEKYPPAKPRPDSAGSAPAVTASGASAVSGGSGDSSHAAAKDEHASQSSVDSASAKTASDSLRTASVHADSLKAKVAEAKAAVKDSVKKASAKPAPKHTGAKTEVAGKPAKKAAEKNPEKTKKKGG